MLYVVIVKAPRRLNLGGTDPHRHGIVGRFVDQHELGTNAAREMIAALLAKCSSHAPRPEQRETEWAVEVPGAALFSHEPAKSAYCRCVVKKGGRRRAATLRRPASQSPWPSARLELPVEPVGRQLVHGLNAVVARLSTPSRLCTPCVGPHQPLDSVRSTAQPGFQTRRAPCVRSLSRKRLRMIVVLASLGRARLLGGRVNQP